MICDWGSLWTADLVSTSSVLGCWVWATVACSWHWGLNLQPCACSTSTVTGEASLALEDGFYSWLQPLCWGAQMRADVVKANSSHLWSFTFQFWAFSGALLGDPQSLVLLKYKEHKDKMCLKKAGGDAEGGLSLRATAFSSVLGSTRRLEAWGQETDRYCSVCLVRPSSDFGRILSLRF